MTNKLKKYYSGLAVVLPSQDLFPKLQFRNPRTALVKAGIARTLLLASLVTERERKLNCDLTYLVANNVLVGEK